jgi:hypothetical protein
MNPSSPVSTSETHERSLRVLILQKAQSIGPFSYHHRRVHVG